VSTEEGLRERKKHQTRKQIADAAIELFAERGFERVPVSDVARAANVSVATVFNYFGTKEALVFSGMEVFEERLVAAIADRPPGQSVAEAFREFVVQPRGLLTSPDPSALDRIAVVARITAGSADLQAKERELIDQCTGRLAALVAKDTGAADGDIEPWVLANALVGVHFSMKMYLHSQVLAGRRGPELTRDLLDQGTRALDLLERGLT
jgi:AcrR family transcriptional regulator